MRPYTVESAGHLDLLMQSLNDAGECCDLLIEDSRGVPYLTFGEDRTRGGEDMVSHLTPADPGSPDYDRPAGEDCGCGGPLPAVVWPLATAAYPVTICGPSYALQVIHEQAAAQAREAAQQFFAAHAERTPTIGDAPIRQPTPGPTYRSTAETTRQRVDA